MRVAGFRFLLGIALVAGVVAVGFGGWAIAADLRESSDTWHGLGVLIGLAGLGVAYPVVVDTDMGWWLAMLPGALLVLALLPDEPPAQ